MTKLAKLSWVLYNITNCLSLIISVVYWAALFNPAKGLTAMDFFVHGFNSIASLADIFIGRRPCRLLHFTQPVGILSVYAGFTAIYWAANGRNEAGFTFIYPIVDWEKLDRTIPLIVVGILVVMPFTHLLVWALHQLRDRCCRKKTQKMIVGQTNPSFYGEERF